MKTVQMAEKRRKGIKTKLRKNPGMIFSYDDLGREFNISAWTIRNDVKSLAADDPKIVPANGKVHYEGDDILTDKRPERYGNMQNPDGLSDPTAGLAIMNTEPEAKGIFYPKPGDVWPTKCANRPDTELYTVIAVNKEKNTATCIKYSKEEDAENCDISIYTKPIKYFVGNARSWSMPLSYLTIIRERIGEFLDIPVKIKTVVSEVPAPMVELPEPIKYCDDTHDNMYTKEQVNLLLAEQKAEIYEECFRMIASR